MTAATLPPQTERAFLDAIIELATLRGWESFHARPGITGHGWRTPGQGTMAKGWPDLVLVRERDRRLIFCECKRDGAKLTPEQLRVRQVLQAVEVWNDGTSAPRVAVVAWRPSDWPDIERTLA